MEKKYLDVCTDIVRKSIAAGDFKPWRYIKLQPQKRHFKYRCTGCGCSVDRPGRCHCCSVGDRDSI